MNVPESIGVVAFTDNDDFSIFVYFYIVLSEKGNAIVVAELPD